MEFFQSVDEALDFAIFNEEESAVYYRHLAEKMEQAWMADTFLMFAKEEDKHKAKLLEVKEGRRLLPAAEKIRDLKIADYVVDVVEGPEMSYQEALILAMKREKVAFRLYTNLADSTDDEGLSLTFQALAQEEAKHKLSIELVYDDVILSEN
jgi:rubrerythrin